MPAVRLKKEWVLLLSAIGLAIAAATAGLAYTYFAGPNRLSVAVGPRDGVEARLLEAYARALQQQRMDVRLRLLPLDDVRQSAEALQHKQADLAVARPDVMLPDNGLTMAILREEAAIIVAPGAQKIAEIKDLARKRLGVVLRHEADLQFFGTILAYYDLSPPTVTIVPLRPEEAEAAVAGRKVDALALLAAPSASGAATLLKGLERAMNGKMTFVPVAEAEAISQKNPVLTAINIPAGALGGRPTLPEEEVKTIGVSYRLMARANLDRGTVSEATQFLFEMRSRLAKANPAANLMKAPDSDDSTSAALPNHRGAIDYFEREQLTFMDRYGDWIYLLMFMGGGLGSATAWIRQRIAKRRRELVDEVLDRLLCILSEARATTAVRDLDELAVEIDGLVTHAVRYARNRTTDTRTMSALILAIDAARAAIADRRRDLVNLGPQEKSREGSQGAVPARPAEPVRITAAS